MNEGRRSPADGLADPTAEGSESPGLEDPDRQRTAGCQCQRDRRGLGLPDASQSFPEGLPGIGWTPPEGPAR
jgi:hypothetical protein